MEPSGSCCRNCSGWGDGAVLGSAAGSCPGAVVSRDGTTLGEPSTSVVVPAGCGVNLPAISPSYLACC